MAPPRPLRTLVALLGAAPLAAAQGAPGEVDYTPELPPTATYPIFTDIAPTLGAPGTEFDDIGSGRGQVIADLLGPDPTDPSKVGPPDGIPDLIQCNSNSPVLPLGALPGEEEVVQIGDSVRPSVLLRGEADGTFTDVTDQVSPFDPNGYNVEYPGGSPWGAFAADVDADGDLDLYYANGGFNTDSKNTLMENLGNGTFQNVSAAAGLDDVQDSYSAIALDYDLDGDVDIYVGNAVQLNGWYQGNPDPDPADRLYQNQGDGTFNEVASQAKCDLKSNTFALTTGDLDRNGWPDIVVSCYKQYNKVFYGDDSGKFSFMAPATNPGKAMSLDDMVPDMFYPGSDDFGTLPTGAEDELLLLGLRTMPVEIADFNGDRWPDVLFVSWTLQQPDFKPETAEDAIFAPIDRAALYLNRGDQDGDGVGDGLFRESAEELGIDHLGGCMCIAGGDYNGDGLPDVYIGGGGPNLPFHNEEDYLYINEPSAWPADFQQNPDQPLTQAFYEIGAVAGTYSNIAMSHGANSHFRGGRVEASIANGGPAVDDEGQRNVYWQNTGNADGVPYIVTEVELVPTLSAPGAPGARVELIRDRSGGAHQVTVLERSIGARFGSYSDEALNAGLGQDGLLFANVTWPSGVREGRILWAFNPQPTELTFTEPNFSMALDATYPPGGGVELTLRMDHFDTGFSFVNVIFTQLVPVAPGLFLPGALLDIGSYVVAPGSPFEASGLVTNPNTGMYGVVALDAVTGEILNAAGVWHEPALADGGIPATWTPPTVEGEGLAGEQLDAKRRAREATKRVVLRADRVELSPARIPTDYRTFELSGSGELLLDSGDVLRWKGGLVELSPRSRTLVERTGGVWVVTTEVPASCCEISVPKLGTYLRFPADAELLSVDGQP